MQLQGARRSRGILVTAIAGRKAQAWEEMGQLMQPAHSLPAHMRAPTAKKPILPHPLS